MRVITLGPDLRRSDRLVLARGAVAASLLIVVGLLLGWVIVSTPLIATLTPGLRPTPMQTGVAILAWAFAIVVPAGFVILGVARAVAALEMLQALRPTAQAPRLAGKLDDRHHVASGLRLPDGRYIHELVVGPFGLAVLGDVPPPQLSRVIGGRWEVRSGRHGWMPLESPLDRASRDAERIRRWLGGDDRDFVVKIHAAVVSADPRATRTPSCAVVAPGEVAGWLSSLPAQRGLTPARHQDLVESIERLATSSR